MFIVLSAPFPDGLNVAIGSKSCLAYESWKGVRVIVSAFTEEAVDGSSVEDWCGSVAQELNDPPSLEYIKFMLRSIKETWKRGAYIRQLQARMRPAFFGADFGRLDFSRPGQGGHSLDEGGGAY